MDHLPAELIERIVFHLDLRSLGRFTRTNRKTNSAIKSTIFWKLYFERHYPYWFGIGDHLADCKTMLSTWVDSGFNLITKRRDLLTASINLSNKSFAYDGNNRFGVLGGHCAPLMSFRVNDDLTFSSLDTYDLPDTPEYRYETLTPTQIRLDDRFIVVGNSTGSIVVFNKQTGEIFSQFDYDLEGAGDPEFGAGPITELYFDRENLFYANSGGHIQMLDFETGQKINELATGVEDVVCTYDKKSNLCFYAVPRAGPVSMIDFRISPTKVCRSWENTLEWEIDIWGMAYDDNELYCSTDVLGPLVFDLLTDKRPKYDPEYAYTDRKVVTTHVDADRLLLGNQKEFVIYDKHDCTRISAIDVSERKDVLHYSFQDSYFIVNQEHSTSIYSVADFGRMGDVPDELLANSLGFNIVLPK